MTVLRRAVLGSAFAVPLAHAVNAAAPVAAGQAPSFFRYRVGDLQVTAIHDGIAYRPLEGFVPNAPPGAVQQALADAFLPTDRFPITFTTLVINTGSKLVLIDTGNGDLGAPTSGTSGRPDLRPSRWTRSCSAISTGITSMGSVAKTALRCSPTRR